MRNPEIGFEFSWGRYGADTEVRRHGYLPMFAYKKAERKAGFWGRLIGAKL